MPDWTYHTIFKPILTRMPYSVAESLVFGAMGRLAAIPPGRLLIQLMGHASPAPSMRVERGDLTFASPVALAAGVDSQSRGTSAISLFGFGLIEVGPVSETPERGPEWAGSNGAIHGTERAVLTPKQLADRLTNLHRRDHVQIIARLVGDDPSACAAELGERVDGFSIEAAHIDQSEAIQAATSGSIYVRIQAGREVDSVLTPKPAGFIVQQGTASTADVTTAVQQLRDRVDDSQVVIAQGNVVEPADAVPLSEAGADLVMIDSGFAEAGPGLPKRINQLLTDEPSAPRPALFSPHFSFFWSGVMGIGLFAGGVMAFLLGATRVLLPYDEEYLGMMREELCGFNEQILPFMSHDRVTLAGTMLSLGLLYVSTAFFGERNGQHWTRCAVLSSAFIGFLSFFLFLGFGYFDPFHAFISAVLFQFILMGLRSPLAPTQPRIPDRHNTPAWRRALWGQLLFVIHGGAILTAGCAISTFGVTTVFVPEDLAFMGATADELLVINPRLIPLVAHDRASFGGMLMSTGVMVLLAAMWGWQRGQRWLWYSLATAGTLAYGLTVAIHWNVGYTSLKHLLPAYGGLAALWLGLALSREWMCKAPAASSGAET